VSEKNDRLLAHTFHCIIGIAIFICKNVATIINIEKFSRRECNNLALKCSQINLRASVFQKFPWGGGLPPGADPKGTLSTPWKTPCSQSLKNYNII